MGKVDSAFSSECSLTYGVSPHSMLFGANRESEVINSARSELAHLGHP